MHDRKDKAVVLDLWLEGPSGMSAENFAGQLGWPSPAAMRGWIRADPRHDPDRARCDSAIMPTKLEVLRRIGEGVPASRASRGAAENLSTKTRQIQQEEAARIRGVGKASGKSSAPQITCTPQDKQYGFTYFLCDIKAWKAGDEYYTNYLFQSAWSISSGV